MPNIKSAIKRVKVAERNRQRNRSWRSAVRTVRTEVSNLLPSTGKNDDWQKAVSQAYKTIDMAVSKGVLHKNAAARRKSRLAQQANVSAKQKTKKKK